MTRDQKLARIRAMHEFTRQEKVRQSQLKCLDKVLYLAMAGCGIASLYVIQGY